MIKQLIKLSNYLDAKGYRKESNYVDSMIRKLAQAGPDPKARLVRLLMEKLDTNDSGALEDRELGSLITQLARYLERTEGLSRADAHYRVLEMIGLEDSEGAGDFIITDEDEEEEEEEEEWDELGFSNEDVAWGEGTDWSE